MSTQIPAPEPGQPAVTAPDGVPLDGPEALDIIAGLDAAGDMSLGDETSEHLLRRFYARCMEHAAELVTASVPPATAGPLTDGDRRLRDAAAGLRHEAARVTEPQ